MSPHQGHSSEDFLDKCPSRLCGVPWARHPLALAPDAYAPAPETSCRFLSSYYVLGTFSIRFSPLSLWAVDTHCHHVMPLLWKRGQDPGEVPLLRSPSRGEWPGPRVCSPATGRQRPGVWLGSGREAAAGSAAEAAGGRDPGAASSLWATVSPPTGTSLVVRETCVARYDMDAPGKSAE